MIPSSSAYCYEKQNAPIVQTKRCGAVTVMNLSNASLKQVRNEVGISRHMPITHLNSASVFESSNSMIGMVLKLDGVTFDTAQESELNDNKRLWHRALSALDARFCLYQTTHRRNEPIALTGKFDNGFATALNEAYHAQFRHRALYVNDMYLTVIYKGFTTGKVGKGLSLLHKLTNKAIKTARAQARQVQMQCLHEALHQLKTTLSDFRPRLLGENDTTLGYSELLQFLSRFPNGGEGLKYPTTLNAIPIANTLTGAKKARLTYPKGNLSHYLSSKRLFFGNHIQFQGATNKDCHFGAIVTIKHYGTHTASIMLDPLLHLESEFITTNTFAIEAKEIALGRINQHEIKMRNVDDKAYSQLAALTEARDQVASGTVMMGYHYNTVLLLAKTQAALDKAIANTIKCYADAGFVAVKETIGLEAAFWAQLPTNLKYIARASLITSENFVDFAPLHNDRTGFRDANHLGSAVTLLETPSKTPHFFNYHVKGRKGNPSKGHGLIIGGNDAGKTALMTFMDAQMNRYGGHTFYFDRDLGAKLYISAIGGHYAILSPDNPTTTCFNPFQLSDTPSNRKLCHDLLIAFCKHDVKETLNAEAIEALTRCVDYAYEKLAPEYRTLSYATKILPLQFPYWPALRRWCRSNGKTQTGDYAYLFDNPIDTLTLQTKMGFDMTHFLDNEPAHVRTPVMLYLLHRIKQVLKGQRVSILLDEGWQYFIDPYWQKALEKLLPTLRKYNGHIVIATQSPASVLNSPLRAMMLDNMPTQLFFANPQAKREDYIEGFNLTHTEYDIIRSNPPASRLFLYKQDNDASLCRLNLGHLPKFLAVLSGNKTTVRLMETIQQEVGNNPENWLPVFYQRIEEGLT